LGEFSNAPYYDGIFFRNPLFQFAGIHDRLKERGVRLINEEPIAIEGIPMAFIHPKTASGVLAELYESIKE